MKKYGKYLIAAVAGLVFFAACDNYEADDHKFGNAVYLDVAETNEVQLTTFGNNKPTYDCALQAELTYPAGQDVAVTLTVDPSLVGTYNARYGTEWTMLDAKYYELSAGSVTIPAGKTTSDVVTLKLKELMGQGEEQAGALPIDETYLLRRSLLCRQTLFGHHGRSAAHRQLDRIPDPRQVFRKQQGLERSDGCNL